MRLLSWLFGSSRRPPQPVHAAPRVEELEPRVVLDGGAQLTAREVRTLLRRAAAVSSSTDAIIAIVDRSGQVLGVRVEGGVSRRLTNNIANLTFAIDGALAKARTGAFFSSNEAPLTSRTIQFISQTTITLREVNSNPNIPNLGSRQRGPGFVAPVGLGGHFPPRIRNTPPVDLFGIEHTNRDSILHPGPDLVKGTGDDILLPSRFNVPTQFIPAGANDPAPESYGFVSGLFVNAQARGIGTLPGGIPIYKNGSLVGGIGVFFPGRNGFASSENSSLSSTFNSRKPDRSLEAEYIAFAAAGGVKNLALPGKNLLKDLAPFPRVGAPLRIDLAGVTLDVFGPGGHLGVKNLLAYGRTLRPGKANSGHDQIVTPTGSLAIDGQAPGTGWLVTPHDGVGITAEEVRQIIEQGIAEANLTRAQIRLPIGQRTKMVFSVADTTGAVLGLFRMDDATFFSVDVAVAKARNVSYYTDPNALAGVDQVPGLSPGVAMTARTFRYLAQPRFPEAIDGSPPGPFSILNDPRNGPASAYQSVMGFDAFNPGTNFRNNRDNIANQNGIIFFPGSSAVFRNATLLGGLGVSGDGVDQDDVVTAGAILNFVPPVALQADQYFVRGVRLPYFKFSRNPRA